MILTLVSIVLITKNTYFRVQVGCGGHLGL